MYELQGKVLLIDRGDADELFTRFGCTNVKTWDAGTMVHRLRRIPAFIDTEGEVGDLLPLVELIKHYKNDIDIVLRNDTVSRVPPIDFLEKEIQRKIGKKRTRSRRKRRRGPLFSFEACHIPPGSILTLKKNPEITCVVVGDPWIVDFGDGTKASFTSRTRDLLDVKESTYLSPMHYWCYNGKLLKYYYKKYQNTEEDQEKRKKELMTPPWESMSEEKVESKEVTDE